MAWPGPPVDGSAPLASTGTGEPAPLPAEAVSGVGGRRTRRHLGHRGGGGLRRRQGRRGEARHEGQHRPEDLGHEVGHGVEARGFREARGAPARREQGSHPGRRSAGCRRRRHHRTTTPWCRCPHRHRTRSPVRPPRPLPRTERRTTSRHRPAHRTRRTTARRRQHRHRTPSPARRRRPCPWNPTTGSQPRCRTWRRRRRAPHPHRTPSPARQRPPPRRTGQTPTTREPRRRTSSPRHRGSRRRCRTPSPVRRPRRRDR